MNAPTIRDVAAKAGVSIATVSRAINSPNKVKPVTLSRVQKAMQDLNYNSTGLISSSVFSLPSSNTNYKHIVDFVVSDLSNNHFALIAKEIGKVLTEKDYNLVVYNIDNDPQLEKSHLEYMLSLGIEGLIINSTCLNNEYIADISHKIPSVLVSRRINGDFQGDYVGSNNTGGTEQLTKYLIEKGHKHIAMITADLHFSTGRERLDGFLSAMDSAHIPINESYLYTGKYFNEMDGVEGCRYLLAKSPKPTAIVVGNNSMAIGVYKYLRSHNINVTEDISIVSFGDLHNSELFWRTPTTVTLSPTYIGKKAAECLLSRIKGEINHNREIIFEPTLIEGQTVNSIY